MHQPDPAGGLEGAAGLARLLGQQPAPLSRVKQALAHLALVQGAAGDQVVEVAAGLPQPPVTLPLGRGGHPAQLLDQRRPRVRVRRPLGQRQGDDRRGRPLDLPVLQPLPQCRRHLTQRSLQGPARHELVGAAGSMAAWRGDHVAAAAAPVVPEVKAGQPLLVDVAIQNTGDMAGGDTLINFVVPDCFELRQRRKPEEEPLVAGNDTAGLPPDNRVAFFVHRPDTWTPVNWQLYHYRLRYLAADQLDRPLPVRLLFDVSDSRFNSRGRRWLPSTLPPLEFQGAPVGAPWPPRPSRRRTMRWARAEPRGWVACLPGNRRDVRDLIVLPEKPAGAR
jgi:hypothetical protein